MGEMKCKDIVPRFDPTRQHYPLSKESVYSKRPAMFLCRPLAPPRLLAVAPPSSALAPWLLRPPSLSLRVVRCMAKEKRVRMVAKQIQRELADMLTRDPILQRAVLPEAALGADRYLSSLTTIADVELSNDLQVRSHIPATCRNDYELETRVSCVGDAEFWWAQVCKVYVSVFGDERGKKVAIEGLKAKTKYVRSQIGKRMKLRLTPEIRFIEDESMERGSRVLFKLSCFYFIRHCIDLLTVYYSTAQDYSALAKSSNCTLQCSIFHFVSVVMITPCSLFHAIWYHCCNHKQEPLTLQSLAKHPPMI